MTILTVYRISESRNTHLKTRIKTSAPYLAGDPRFFYILLGKKHFPPPVHMADRLAGWRVCGCEGERVCGLAGLAGMDI